MSFASRSSTDKVPSFVTPNASIVVPTSSKAQASFSPGLFVRGGRRSKNANGPRRNNSQTASCSIRARSCAAVVAVVVVVVVSSSPSQCGEEDEEREREGEREEEEQEEVVVVGVE